MVKQSGFFQVQPLQDVLAEVRAAPACIWKRPVFDGE